MSSSVSSTKYIGIREMAERNGVSENTIRRKIDDGLIPTAPRAWRSYDGEHRRVLRADFERVFAGQSATTDTAHTTSKTSIPPNVNAARAPEERPDQ